MIHLTHANFFPYETYRKEQQDIIRLIDLVSHAYIFNFF